MTTRRILAALLVAATASIGLVAQPAAAATSATPATVVVAPDRGGVVEPGRGLGVSVTVTNTGTTRLTAGRLTFSLDPAPVASSATLLNSIAKPPEALQGQLAAARIAVPALDAAAGSTVRATLGKKDLSTLLSSTSGASRLYVQYLSSTERTPGASSVVKTIAVSSVVKMSKASNASVGFGTVIPVLAPANTTGIVDVTTQQQLASPGGTWGRALHAAEASPSATVALDPEVVASIRLAGQSAPPEASGFLEALGRLPNQFVRLPYADADETLERAAGVTPPLQPSSFAGVVLAGAGGDDATPAPTTTAGTGDDVPTELTAWNWSDQAVTWPVPHTATTADLPMLTRDRATVLLASDDVADTAARRTAGPLATTDRGGALVADATASALLVTASGEGTRADAALATLTGLLATAAVTRETTALLAVSGRAADTPHLDRVLSLLDRQPWVRGRSLAQLGTQSSRSTVRLRPRPPVPASRTAIAKSLGGKEREVQQLGTVVTSGAATVTAPRRLALLALLSAAWRGDDDGAWRTAASTTEKSFADVTRQVSLLKGSNSNAIGTDGQLQVTVSNQLPVPVRVRIKARVSNGRLQFQDASNTTVDVPARSAKLSKLLFKTITNGNTDVTLQLTNADGQTIGIPVVRRVSVTAGFDTVVAVVLLSALGLLLALGVYRNIARRRRPRTAEA